MIKQGKTVEEAKRYGIFQCHESTKLFDAAKYMVSEDVSSLAVVDDNGYLVGIVTRVDLLRAYIETEDWRDHPVGRFMVRDVVTVEPHNLLQHVAELLIEKGIHRVVVVQEDAQGKKPVAVVSAADLVYHMVKSP
jgi:CBS domain-containing protein